MASNVESKEAQQERLRRRRERDGIRRQSEMPEEKLKRCEVSYARNRTELLLVIIV